MWSGVGSAGQDRQYLYIAPMDHRRSLAGRVVALSLRGTTKPTRWEFTETRQGPWAATKARSVLKHNDHPRPSFYSCGAGLWLPPTNSVCSELTGTIRWQLRRGPKLPASGVHVTPDTFGVRSFVVRCITGRDRKLCGRSIIGQTDRDRGWPKRRHFYSNQCHSMTPAVGPRLTPGPLRQTDQRNRPAR